MSARLYGKGTGALACLLVCLSVSTALGAGEPFDRLVPDDTAVFVSLRNYPDLAARFLKSPLGKALADPSVQKFLDQLAEQAHLPPFRQELQRAGITPLELSGLPAGEVCLAIGALEPAREPPFQALLAIDTTGRRELAQAIIDRALAAVEAAREGEALARIERQFNGKTIVRLSESPQSAEEDALYYMLDDQVLLVSFGGTRMMEKFIVLSQGGPAGALSGERSYRRAMARVGADNDVVFYCDVSSLWDLLPSTPEVPPDQAAPAAPGPREVVESLGLLGVRTVAAGWRLDPNGIAAGLAVGAPAPRRGALKAFVPPRADLTVPPFVAERPAYFARFYFNFPVLWDAAMSTLNRFDPDAYQAIQRQVAGPDAPAQIQEDIVRALGGWWTVYVPPLEDSGAGAGARGLGQAVMVDLTRPEAFEAAFNKLSAVWDPQRQLITTFEVAGQKVYKINMPIPAEPDQPATMAPHLAFARGKLLFTTSGALIRQIIQDSARPSSPFAGNELLRGALQAAGGSADGVLYEARPDAIRADWEGFAKDLAEEGIELPPWEVLRPCIGPSVSTLKWDERGLLLRGRYVFPERGR